RFANVSQAHLSAVEAGRRRAGLSTLTAISAALGGALRVQIDPQTGPSIRDHIQARMLEALLRILDSRWTPSLEVPVHRPVRGVIDLVLHDVDAGLMVATESESTLRRIEQQIRWAHEKASALVPSGSLPILPGMAPHVSSLLLLRSTRSTRELARRFGNLLDAAYPGRSDDAFAALTHAGSPWPGSSIVWVAVNGSSVRILDRTPAGIDHG
ncbi:MAG TPA: helix-turn-helix transcriptional regulator, partial [Candidatus Limnocylindrales bacterium]